MENPVNNQIRCLILKAKQVQREITYVLKHIPEDAKRVPPEELQKLITVSNDLIRETYLLAGFQHAYELKCSK